MQLQGHSVVTGRAEDRRERDQTEAPMTWSTDDWFSLP